MTTYLALISAGQSPLKTAPKNMKIQSSVIQVN
jgi:hypothetical protein